MLSVTNHSDSSGIILISHFIVSWWYAVCVTTGDDCEEHYSVYLLHFVIWVLLFFSWFFLFSSDHEFWKAVNFILRHCTVYQSCKYFTSTEKNQTICFVVSQIKNFLLFWWFVEVFCCSKSFFFVFFPVFLDHICFKGCLFLINMSNTSVSFLFWKTYFS